MRTRLVVAVVAVLLLAASCGNDASDTLDQDEQKAARTLAIEFQGTNPSDFTRDAGICMGKQMVSQLGTDQLVRGGLLNEDLTLNENRDGITDRRIAEGYADAVMSCEDVRGEIENRRDRYPDATDKDVDEYVACVEAIDDKILREAIVATTLKQKGQASTSYTKQARKCTKQLGTPRG